MKTVKKASLTLVAALLLAQSYSTHANLWNVIWNHKYTKIVKDFNWNNTVHYVKINPKKSLLWGSSILGGLGLFAYKMYSKFYKKTHMEKKAKQFNVSSRTHIYDPEKWKEGNKDKKMRLVSFENFCLLDENGKDFMATMPLFVIDPTVSSYIEEFKTIAENSVVRSDDVNDSNLVTLTKKEKKKRSTLTLLCHYQKGFISGKIETTMSPKEVYIRCAEMYKQDSDSKVRKEMFAQIEVVRVKK